jgi:prolyl-tRNA synthetase
MGHKLRKISDFSLKQGVYVTGANKEGVHVKGVTADKHFADAEFADIHLAGPGDACVQCGKPLRIERVIEIGNIFKLGTKYSEPLGALYLDEQGKEQPIVMGCYGIGPARIAAAAVEQSHDGDGIIWPETIAPFQVHLVCVNTRDAKLVEIAEGVYRALGAAGLEVLFDDRDERPGFKFKDADLLGCPVRVTVGNRAVKQGTVEVRRRRGGEEQAVAPAAVPDAVRSLLRPRA